MLDDQASGISHRLLLDVKFMSKKFQCKRKVSGLGGADWMEMACGKLALHPGGTRKVLREHTETCLPAPTSASLHPRRIPAASPPPAGTGSAEAHTANGYRLAASLPVTGAERTAQVRQRWRPPQPPREPQPGAAGTSTTRHLTRGTARHLHVRARAKISSAFSSGCDSPRIFIKH